MRHNHALDRTANREPVDQAQDVDEQGSGDGDLRHLESDVTAVAHDLDADFDQLLPQGIQRPILEGKAETEAGAATH